MQEHADVVVIGAGAAGLFAALSARGALRGDGSFEPVEDAPDVLLVDGQELPGRKILISGGGRCNVTNEFVTHDDFTTDVPNSVRNILREMRPQAVRRFFEDRGVPLRPEPIGKLFPAEGRARDVLGALHAAAQQAGVRTRFGTPVEEVVRDGDGWRVGDIAARRVIVATGGKSVPMTGSTGFGYGVAESVGHTLVPPVPALAPLTAAIGESMAGVTLPAILTVVDETGREEARSAGSMLFTHRGVSGPAALDISGAFERALAEGRHVRVLADLWSLAAWGGPWAQFLDKPKAPGSCLAKPPRPAAPEDVERVILDAAGKRSGRQLGSLLAKRLPRRVVARIVPSADRQLAQLTRTERRAAAEAVTRLDLQATGSEGFEKAEVTAGGVPLRELDRRTLESRLAPGLHFCGEVCHVTGRLGGFNFQWAWSSGYLAGRACSAPGA